MGMTGLTALGYKGIQLITSPELAFGAVEPVQDKPPPVRRPATWTPIPIIAVESPVQDLEDLAPMPPSHTISLTIDDGPHSEWTPQVLDLLAEHQIPATFFLIGQQVKQYPRLARRIAAAGHQVCNHTMNHPMPFGELSTNELRQEIAEAYDLIADVTGIAPTSFRAPGGDWSQRVLDLAAEHGMLSIDWSVDPRDWDRPGVAQIRTTLLDSEPRSIMLCHDGGGDRSQTVEALREVIPTLKERGLIFVAL